MDTEKVNAFVRAFDETTDFVNYRSEQGKQAVTDEIADLLANVENRDSRLWNQLDASTIATVDDYERKADRDIDWILGLSAVAAASLTQAVISNGASLILEPVAYREQLLGGFDLTREELIAAGKRGTVGTAAVTTEFRSLAKAAVIEIDEWNALSASRVYTRLRGIGALPPIERTVAEIAGKVSRLVGYLEGSPQFRDATIEIVETLGSRTMKAQVRRAVERITTERQADGSRNSLLVWICEGGKNTCAYCLARSGEVKTYQQWLTDGMPGADVCAGGDLCHCGLWAY